MPSYSPLPNIELDPRNEGQLVQAAARRVYEASNATLNDFSSGSPIVALLEGQAFAQAEFLQFANQFPESVLVEWIGPFLGAQRRTGTGALVNVTFTIDPRDDQFDIFPGYQVASDPNLTGGESVTFVTTERLVISAGQSQGTVPAISVFRSADANVAPGTITRSLSSLAGVESVTNVEAAAGGQDPELLSEVKERFFSLIRRRNPVSAEDWTDFFSDALGPGAACSVLPRRSERGTYKYEENYVTSAPAVSFFVLNPDGSPITTAQQGALENLIRWSLPVEFIGFVYPMEVNDVDFVIGLNYDPAKPYAQNLDTMSETVRNSLFAVMQPNAVFPTSYDQQVTDVESALTTSFPLTLGTTNQYLDPDISYVKAYVPPKGISSPNFILTSPVPLKTGDAIQQGDLVVEQGNTYAVYYEALQNFTPQLSDKTYYVNIGNLDVEIIKSLENGDYDTGDVISLGAEGTLHVVLTSFTYRGLLTSQELQTRGFISAGKDYSPWIEGEDYISLTEAGAYNPQIIAYEQTDTQFNVFVPSTPVAMAANRRPGHAVYVVQRNFTLAANTTTLGSAQNAGLVATADTEIQVLFQGEQYDQGTFVKTPDPTELLAGDISRENCYIDQVAGAIEVYGKVLKTFAFRLNGDYVTSVDDLVKEGALELVQPVPFIDCKGESSFSARPFRYTARFLAGEYLRYRPSGGYDAGELEDCTKTLGECGSVSENCTKLFNQNLEIPRYFFVLKDFTPNTTDLAKLVEQEVIEEVLPSAFKTNYTSYVPSTQTVYSTDITNNLVESGIIASAASLNIGDTVIVVGDFKEQRGLYDWNGSLWIYESPGTPTFRDMFRFAPGDVATFRSTSASRSYIATKHVTPILDLEVYFDSGVFESTTLTQTVPWIDPNYRVENVIVDFANGAYSYYRPIRSFTPPSTRTVWNGTVVNSTPRIEEIFGNVLKFVNLVESADAINSRLSDGASTVKLGTCQLDLTSKSIGSITSTFVWESTQYISQGSQLSDYPGTSFIYGPVDYGTGTLAL